MRTVYLLAFFIATNFLFAQEIESPTEIRIEKGIQSTGDIFHYGLPAIAGLSTLITEGGEGGIQFLKSFGTNLALTYAIKYVINKPRPEGAKDGLAFPSGHTSTAFQGASFIQRKYGWKYGAPAYLIAGFVAYSRVEGYQQRHDGWDVLGGMILGIGSTYLFTSPRAKDDINIALSANNGFYTIGLVYKF